MLVMLNFETGLETSKIVYIDTVGMPKIWEQVAIEQMYFFQLFTNRKYI